MERTITRRKVYKVSMRALVYVFASLIALFFIFPLVWMLVTSTKTELQYASDLGSFKTFLPYVADLSTFFDNYASVFTQYDIWKYGLNSIGYALAVVVGNIIVNALAGYVMAKFNFPGKGFISFLIMFLLIVPVETTIIPLYSIVHNLGISGTVLAVILPPLVSVFNIFLFQQFFGGISKEYIEAAQLDGAGKGTIFFRITFQAISPTTFYLLTVCSIGAFQVLGEVQIMAAKIQNYLGSSYRPVMLFIYDMAFYDPAGYGYGIAAAASWLLAIFILVVTRISFWLSKKWVHYEF